MRGCRAPRPTTAHGARRPVRWWPKYTRVGLLRRGTLEVVVANSTLVQELGFQKRMLLRKLAVLLPDEGIENLRFRVGNIE